MERINTVTSVLRWRCSSLLLYTLRILPSLNFLTLPLWGCGLYALFSGISQLYIPRQLYHTHSEDILHMNSVTILACFSVSPGRGVVPSTRGSWSSLNATNPPIDMAPVVSCDLNHTHQHVASVSLVHKIAIRFFNLSSQIITAFYCWAVL